MGKPTENENEIKIAAANKAIDHLINESTPNKNMCIEKRVREVANKLIAEYSFKNISRSTILQSKNPEWIAVNKRIEDHKKLYKNVKKVVDRGLIERNKELEEFCKNQNTTLMQYLTKIESLEEKIVGLEVHNSELVDQLRDQGGKCED